MRPMEGRFCARCSERLAEGQPFDVDRNESLCPVCENEEPAFGIAAAYGSYETGLRELIHLLKYDNVRPAANVLGSMLAKVIVRLQPCFGANQVLVVPIPLHRAKQRQRGFNQAELIARAALKHCPEGIRFELNPHLLERRRVTQSQIGLTQQQRRANLRGAFRVVKPEKIAGREILLVDDVFTTGTTVSECARVLRRAGAAEIWVATVARTLKLNIRGMENFENLPVAVAG
jgi:ComF family protein